MGAFYLVFEPDPEVRARASAAMDASLRAQGFRDGVQVEAGSVVAAFFGKLTGGSAQVHRRPDGRFVALSGTALYDGVFGADVARKLSAYSVDDTPEPSRLIGSFCVVHGQGNQVRMFLDPLGVYKVYASPDSRVFSSSFLAVAATARGITPDPQGVYEYVHQEATYGETTVAQEIRLARCSGHYEFGDEARFVAARDDWTPRLLDVGMQVHVDACLERLRQIYREVGSCFQDRVDTALSGGYDSRLTLALLLERGITPCVHVYGADDSMDVAIARTISAAEGFALHHVNKDRYPSPAPDQIARVVRENYLVFDGWPSAGIFDGGADRATRFERAGDGRLMLNGGGGEIFRNFFYLPGGRYATREVVWSFYSRYAPRWCTAAFDEAAYVAALERKLGAVAGGGPLLSREQVEYLYPAFRCGFWMGRNNSVNARIGWALTPFIDPELVRLAVRVPLRFKNHGRFEAALIRAVSPSLARHPSDYGHAFDRGPPLPRILKDYATLLRPPRLRRYTYRIRHRRPGLRPRLLRREALEPVIDLSMPTMSRFFHVDRVNDPAAFARLATLEYLFADLGAT